MNYKEEIINLRDSLHMDNKDWSRAIHVDLDILTALTDGTHTLTKDMYEKLVELTNHADPAYKTMLKFSSPKVITICNHKGGSGKSTMTIGIASVLADMGYSVLIIDSDDQMNITTTLLRGKSEEFETKNLCTAFINEADINKQIIKSNFDNISVVAGSRRMASVNVILTTMLQTGQTHPNDMTKKMFSNIRNNSYFDFIIVDTSADISVTNTALMSASDYLLCITEGSLYNISGVMDMMSQYNQIKQSANPNLKFLGIVLNRVNSKKVIVKKAQQTFEEIYPGLLLNSYVRNDATIEAAQWNGDLLNQYQRSNGWKDMSSVTKEILDRIGKEMNENG